MGVLEVVREHVQVPVQMIVQANAEVARQPVQIIVPAAARAAPEHAAQAACIPAALHVPVLVQGPA